MFNQNNLNNTYLRTDLKLSILFLLALHNGSLQATELDILPVVNITASHLSDTPDSVKNAIITITANEIEQRKPQNLIELLKGLPGIDASQSGGPGGRNYISIRGGDPNFTLFLLNGVKINNPTDTIGGGVDLAFLNPELIERIDVYPGGLSSIQGAGSLGGVISITTKDQSMDPGFSTSVNKGSNNTSRVNFLAANQFGDTPHRWGLSGSYQDGGDIVPGDRHVSRNINGTVELELRDNILLTGQFAASNGYAAGFPEDSGGFRLSVLSETEKRDNENLSGSLRLLAELPRNWILTSQASIYNNREQLVNPGIAAGALAAVPAHNSDSDYWRKEISIGVSRKFKRTSLSLGGEYVTEQGKSKEIIDLGFPFTGHYNLTRDSIGLYGELSYALTDKLTLDGSARHERPSSNETANIFRLAASYQLASTGNTLQASWSEGYKLPSLFALGDPLVGNSNLNPETSDTYEIRFSSQYPTLNTGFNFAVFRSKYRDLIDFDPATFAMVNRDQVQVNGAEVSMTNQPLHALSLAANLSYNDTEIVGESVKLRRRPLWKGSISAQWISSSRWDMRLDANYNGEFYDSSIPTGMIKMPDFWSLDAAINWKISDSTRINLKLTNLLDDSHEASVGFPSPGRQAFLTFTTYL